MNTSKILSAVSAAALLGISSVALAQGTGGSATPGGSGSPGGATQRQPESPSANTPSTSAPSTSHSGSMSKEGMNDGAKSNRAQGKEMDRDGMKSDRAQGKEMDRDGTKSNRAQGKEMDRDGMKSDRAQGKEMDRDGAKQNRAQGKEMDKSGPNSNQRMGQERDKSGSTVGAAPGGGVNLTTEQRTTIRKEVLTDRAPRVSNVNFDVHVGTVVPRTVHVVEVPETLIRIHPQWRGHRYFVYNDEIIIIDAHTMKIVAVLEV